MFRICKIVSQVTYRNIRPVRFGEKNNILGNHKIWRFYCDKKKDDSYPWQKKDPCATKSSKPKPEVYDPTCQKSCPEELIKECERPDPCTVAKPIPQPPCDAKEPCKPDLMSSNPVPSEPWGPYTDARNKRNKEVFLWGLLSLALSLAGLYYVGILGFNTTVKRKQEEVEIDNKIPKHKKDSSKRTSTFGISGPKIKKADRQEKYFFKPPLITKFPKDSCEIPSQIPYLLIGGGTASFAAFRAIKSTEPKAKVLVISKEGDIPYMRPPLSKEMWFLEDPKAISELRFKQWNGTERSLFYEPIDFYVHPSELLKKENGGVAVARGWTVKKLDVRNNTAILEDGYEIKYDKCLIATGAKPLNLRVLESVEVPKVIKDKITLFRNVFDFKELEEACRLGKSIVVIGGGFLGSELACAIARYNRKRIDFKVHQVFRESGNMAKVLPEYLSMWTMNKVKAEGVNVIPNTELEKVELCKGKDLQGYETDRVKIVLENGDTIMADHIVVAVGVKPNNELAQNSALETDPETGGFVVNTELAARTNLFAAGDCACFYDTKFGRRLVEHHDHAVVTGRLAGENMAGASKPYLHQSMFWSDLGPDVGYEAIGIVDSSLATVGVFAKGKDSSDDSAVTVCADSEDSIKKKKNAEPECDKALVAVVEEEKPENEFIEEPKEMEEVHAIEVKSDKTEELEPEKKQSDLSKEEFSKGIIFYLRNDIVVGIVLWNVFNRMPIARQVLKDGRKYDDLNEVAKLFNIHED